MKTSSREALPESIIRLISAEKAHRHKAVPLRVEGDNLVLGFAADVDHEYVSEISFASGMNVLAEGIDEDTFNGRMAALFEQNGSRPPVEHLRREPTNGYSGSTVEFVEELITDAVREQASDIHFEVYDGLFRIRIRIDGHLVEIARPPFGKSLPVLSRLKIMANLDISEKRRPQDGRIKFRSGEKTVDIRVSTLPTQYGEKVVLRILDKDRVRLDLSRLGLDERQYELMKRKIRLPYGMVLVTGPTGSGKTTTLYAALQEINAIERNILTIEDPIEYNLTGVNQSNVKADIGFTFAGALRAFLRQDPDVIMVGEIRDRETAEIALRASLTGHLVLSTLHTNDSVSALTRLVDMGIEPFLVGASVRLIIAQRLIRRLCGCKERQHEAEKDPVLRCGVSYRPNGCSSCNHTGYRGRIGIFEMLDVDDEIGEMMSRHCSASGIRNRLREKGFTPLADAGAEKIKIGETSHEEVLRETVI